MISMISFVVKTDIPDLLLNDKHWLIKFYQIAIFYQNCFYGSVILGLNLVHQLHCFHDSKYLTFFHGIAHLYIRCCIRSTCRIKGSNQRTFYGISADFFCCI